MSGNNGDCPQAISAAGAIMPAAAYVAPSPGCGSTTVTEAPWDSSSHAVARPMIPAPMTMTCMRFSLRRHDPHQV